MYPWQNQLLVTQLCQLMHREGGIGLSANQCGVACRVFVMEIGNRSWACFNPKVLFQNNEFTILPEGCLSFPGKQCIINRANDIEVSYQDYCGNVCLERLQGLMARCFQHELDHLDGITMWQRYEEQHAEQS